MGAVTMGMRRPRISPARHGFHRLAVGFHRSRCALAVVIGVLSLIDVSSDLRGFVRRGVAVRVPGAVCCSKPSLGTPDSGGCRSALSLYGVDHARVCRRRWRCPAVHRSTRSSIRVAFYGVTSQEARVISGGDSSLAILSNVLAGLGDVPAEVLRRHSLPPPRGVVQAGASLYACWYRSSDLSVPVPPAGCRRGGRRRSVSRRCIRVGRVDDSAPSQSVRFAGSGTIALRGPESCVERVVLLPVRVGAGLNGMGRSLDAVCRHVVGRRAAERAGGTCCRTPAGSVLRIGVARRGVRSCCSTWSSRVRVAETVALCGPGPGMGELSCGCEWPRG